MMSGRIVAPRWRLPLWVLLAIMMTGCAARSEKAGEDASLDVPSVRMALVKIPLNRSNEEDLLANSDPIERFTPEPVAVAYTPPW